MAFSLSHTVTMDNTSDATQQQTCRDALDYFYGTFLPARGWTNTFHSTNRYRTQMPVLDVLTNTTKVVYGWVSYTSTTIREYEDATYTTVPGDLGTDGTGLWPSTNVTFWSSGFTYKDKDWKFWTSDEDSSLYLVTQGSKTWFWGGKPKCAIYEENTTYATANNVDTYRTHIYYPISTHSWASGNAPLQTGASTTGLALNLIDAEGPRHGPDSYAFARPCVFTYTDGVYLLTLDYNDIRRKVNDVPYRGAVAPEASSIVTDTLEKYHVNGTDWWVSYGGITSTLVYIAFNFGTSEPDFS